MKRRWRLHVIRASAVLLIGAVLSSAITVGAVVWTGPDVAMPNGAQISTHSVFVPDLLPHQLPWSMSINVMHRRVVDIWRCSSYAPHHRATVLTPDNAGAAGWVAGLALEQMGDLLIARSQIDQDVETIQDTMTIRTWGWPRRMVGRARTARNRGTIGGPEVNNAVLWYGPSTIIDRPGIFGSRYDIIWSGAIGNVLIFSAAIWLVLIVPGGVRRWRRRRRGLCARCGYDLRESGAVCPECGGGR